MTLQKIIDGNSIASTLLSLMLQHDARNSWITGALNRDSERVYFPNSNISIVDFIFGKKRTNRSALMRYLSDSFRTERNKINKRYSFNEKVALTYDEGDEYSYDPPPAIPRRWKNYISPKKLNPEYQSVIDKLPPKQRTAYLSFIETTYYSGNVNNRQNLLKAKRKLIAMGLNNIQVPLPKSQQ